MTETIVAAPLALVLEWDKAPGDELVGIRLIWADTPGTTPSEHPGEHAQNLRYCLARYVAGDIPEWPELPYAMDEFTPFRRAVLTTLRDEVGPGVVVSYGELARMAGRPGAARAVGRAMATNPWPLVIPCHRVVGAGGALTGFSGTGMPMKRYLLQTEGVPTTDDNRLAVRD